jgi:uncharacterized tellurite resistance protein B-like protein
LLTRVATVHDEMSQATRAKLHVVLRSHLILTIRLPLGCSRNLPRSTGPPSISNHFTHQLNQLLNDESRRRLVQMMWEVDMP